MKKLVVMLLASLFVANVALAVVDPDENMMGIYFDMDADSYCMPVGPYAPFDAYVMLTNPNFPAVYGYEFGFEVVGNMLFSGVGLAGTGPIDVGGGVGNHIVGLGAPLAAAPATLLATLTLIPLDTMPITFDLFGATPASIGDGSLPVILLENSGIATMGLSTGIGNVNAILNYDGPCEDIVAADEASWDAVKSLYR